MVAASFIFFLLFFVFIGIASVRESKGTTEDYLVAGRNIPPWMVALSAVSTCNSGFMFIGQIGYTYVAGLSSIWLAIGWVFGDFLASLFIHKKLRVVSEKEDAHSFGGILSTWHATSFVKLRFLIGIVSVIFLGAYAAAQFNAGSKALHVLFDWDISTGAIVGSIIVLAYCLAGGIRASIWTDAAQSIVMIVAMAVLFVSGINEVGGLSAMWSALTAVSPDYMSLFPAGGVFGPFLSPLLFAIGWMFAGFGVVGQPHIMVRFMTMESPEQMAKVRVYYYSWYTLFYIFTFLVALSSRVLLPDSGNFDAELALPLLAQQLLPDIAVGLVLAGLFAATISTADSLILSCSAALTRDFHRRLGGNIYLAKLSTLIVTALALGLALSGNESVFALVTMAWAAMASAFGPLLAVYALGRKPGESLCIAMLVAGVGTVFLWKGLGLSDAVYEILPGMLAGFLVYFVGSRLKSSALN